jgi:uncharacterized protein
LKVRSERSDVRVPWRWNRDYLTVMSTFLFDGPADASLQLVLAHGAGAAMDSAFMSTIAALLGERGVRVVRFEFAYMAGRREGGKKRPPPKAETLTGEYHAALAALEPLTPGQKRLIGGKSMGGRVASLIAGELYTAGAIAGLVCLGYPFHPPNTPTNLRTAHLEHLTCPTLILQGERDPLGSKAEVEGLSLSSEITVQWIGDGDHDLGPRGASGFTRKGNLLVAATAIAERDWSPMIGLANPVDSAGVF